MAEEIAGQSQRAREAAGWVWFKVLGPPDLKRHLQGLAAAYGLSLNQALLDGLMHLAHEVPREWWARRRQSVKTRFPRSDRGRPRPRGERQTPSPSAPE